MDIREEEDRCVIQANVPGMEAKNIGVVLENDTLKISGKKTGRKDEQRSCKLLERRNGFFMWRFTLPNSADAERISAEYKDCVLEVVIPRN